MGHEGHDHHHHEHDTQGGSGVSVSVAIVHVMTRPDTAGILVSTVGRLIENAGHAVVQRVQCQPVPSAIMKALDAARHDAGARVVLFLGGTALGRSDLTIETLTPLLTKQLPGFGEWARAQLFKELGSHVMAVRTVAGTVNGALVFAVPDDVQQATRIINALVVPHVAELLQQTLR